MASIIVTVACRYAGGQCGGERLPSLVIFVSRREQIPGGDCVQPARPAAASASPTADLLPHSKPARPSRPPGSFDTPVPIVKFRP